jgi:hypothetical protein
MRIIYLEQENFNLYSPSTGDVLYHTETGFNIEARSLQGFWAPGQITEPFIKDPVIREKWEQYLNGTNEEMYPMEDPQQPDVEEFLYCHYEGNPVLIAFRVQITGQPDQVAWFAVDMEPANKDD